MAGEAPPTGADAFIGRTIANRFEMVAVLGEGGMGKVYTAKDKDTGQLAAVKVVHGKLSGNEEYVARLKQEARTAGRLRHDSAVRILAHGETENGEAYLAMEYCPGRSLKEVVAKEKHLAISRSCNIVAQVLGAVGAAHKQGIIHRDLKPENIKIAPDPLRGEGVKVLDFGVAKFVGGEGAPEMENAVKTKTGIILGTPKYMAPEQIRGEPVDGRADIYSCGAILYELLSGVPPFQAEDVFGYVTKHLKEPVMTLTERCPEYQVPKELDDLVLWMLEKNPMLRPKDAAQVITILDRFARGSSSARLKFMGKVAGCWLVPAAAAAAVAWTVVPPEIKVTMKQAGAAGEKDLEAIVPFSMGLVRLHGVFAALGLGIAGTAGVLWQPRLSVAAFVRRMSLAGGIILATQALALVFGGALFSALTYGSFGILVFAAFALAWPLENRVLRFVFAGLAAPVLAAVLNPVPLRLAAKVPGVEGSLDQEFFLRIWRSELWQGGGLQSVGGNALLVVLVMGVLIGVGTAFLPKPGRGSSV